MATSTPRSLRFTTLYDIHRHFSKCESDHDYGFYAWMLALDDARDALRILRSSRRPGGVVEKALVARIEACES